MGGSTKQILSVAVPIVASFALPGIGTAIGSYVGSALVGAVAQGAIIGAGTQAILGGSVGQGALYGGLGGAVGYGIGELASGFSGVPDAAMEMANASGDAIESLNATQGWTGVASDTLGEAGQAGAAGLQEGGTLADLGSSGSELQTGGGTLSELQAPTVQQPSAFTPGDTGAGMSTPDITGTGTPDLSGAATPTGTSTFDTSADLQDTFGYSQDMLQGSQNSNPYQYGGAPVYDNSTMYTPPEDLGTWDTLKGRYKDLMSYMPSKGGSGMSMLGGLGNLYSAYNMNQQADYLRGMGEQVMGNNQAYNNLLQSSYTNPEAFLGSSEFKALNDLYLNDLKRKDAAAGRVSQYGARANLAQKQALANLGQYRQGLTGAVSANSPGQVMQALGSTAALKGSTVPALGMRGLQQIFG